MRISNALRHTITTFAALAMLTGCSGGSSQMGPSPLGQVPSSTEQASQAQLLRNGRLNSILAGTSAIVSGRPVKSSFFSPDAKRKPLIFVSDYTGNVVDIYLQSSQTMVGQITGQTQPADVAADRANNVYIADSRGTGATQHVAVYAPPYTGLPKLTISNPAYNPRALAVSTAGLLAVADSCNGSCFYVVNFYAKNSTTACATVDVPNGSAVSGDAFDDAGTLFIVGQNGANGFIGEITGGCKAKKVKVLTVNNALGNLAAVQIDKADRIAILGLDSHTIYTYNHPSGSSLGSPVSTTTLTATSTFHFAFPVSGRYLYTGGYINGSAMVAQYFYPAGGSPVNVITFGGLPYGVAVTPALIP